MKCKWCGESKPLVKAHIIPESFFRRLKKIGGDRLQLMTDLSCQYPKKSPIGAYDTTILCNECEGKFSKADDDGAKTLLNSIQDLKALNRKNEPYAFILPNVNVDNLKRFLLSVLWRASVSRHELYREVSLGKFQDKIKEVLDQNLPISKGDFSFILTRFDDSYLSSSILSPTKERFDGVNYYCISLVEFIIFIKVDNRISPAEFLPFELEGVCDLPVLLREFLSYYELSIAKRIIDNNS